MGVLALLSIIAVIQLCRCGDDKDGFGGVDSTEPSTFTNQSSNHNLQGGASSQLGAAEEDVCQAIGPKENPREDVPLMHGPSNGHTINLAMSNPLIFQEFDYVYNHIPIRLIVPNKNVNVTKLVDDKKTIWIAEEWDKLEYLKIGLKDNNPNMVLVVTSRSSGLIFRRFVNTLFGWGEWKEFGSQIRKLTRHVPKIENFSLDISHRVTTTECTTFETRLVEKPVRLHFPKPGYNAAEVVDGHLGIWKACGDEICLSCDLYFENNSPKFLLLNILEKGEGKSEWFEMEDREWKSVTEDNVNNWFRATVISGDMEGFVASSEKRESPSYLERLFLPSPSHRPGGRARVPSDPSRYEEDTSISLSGMFSGLFSSRRSRSRSSDEARSKRSIVRKFYRGTPTEED
ncbi:signal peptide-containing protein [Theileria equi strain WA]|uniref:Signal peptide-containing protein n=1 Tax=Theileria equi strain WA TaxID=1537102 RepID=L0AWL0_THEEQ|nr:signal peptide-containing protein [Theileria equi strain WA]AFZ79925.1 signal peptide-containing protein [Theileria equi strain WA]|eukprot:XP_004829591.1 signal peptide-containing protein [Theileria equi strain WA]